MAKRRTSGDTAMNAIIAVVIIVVLGLGVWAAAPKISESIKNREAASDAADGQQTATIANAAESEGISFDEYIEKYGLKDASLTAEDSVQSAFYEMTVENFAKASSTTVEELMSRYSLPESVTSNMKWSEAMLEMPAGVALGGDEQFAQAKEAYGLGDEFTAQSRWGDVQSAMVAKMVQQQAAQASAEPEQSAASDSPAADKDADNASDSNE